MTAHTPPDTPLAPYEDAEAEERPDLAERLGVPRCMTLPFDYGTKVGISVTLPLHQVEQRRTRRHAVICVDIEEGLLALEDWLANP